MTKIISAMAFKGGSTKTFTITQLAAACGRAGLLTVVIDADMQANAGNAMGVTREDAFSRLITGGEEWRDLLKPAPLTFANILHPLIQVLSSGYQTGRLNKRDNLSAEFVERVDQLKGWADVVLIDTAPGYDEIHAAVHAVSDYVILPTLMEVDSIESLDQSLEVMEATVEDGRHVPEVLGILPNRYSYKYTTSRNLHDMLKVMYRRSFRIFDPISESVACLDARNRGLSLYAHAETVKDNHFGARLNHRAAERAVANFDLSIGQFVVELIRKEAAA